MGEEREGETKANWKGTNIENEKRRKLNYGYWILDWLMAKWTANLQEKLYTQAIVRLLSLALPQLHVTLSKFWAWIVLRTTSYWGVEGLGIWGNDVVLLLTGPAIDEQFWVRTKTSGDACRQLVQFFYYYSVFEIWNWGMKIENWYYYDYLFFSIQLSFFWKNYFSTNS